MEDSLLCQRQASTAQGCHSVKLIIMRIHYVPNVNYFLTRIIIVRNMKTGLSADIQHLGVT